MATQAFAGVGTRFLRKNPISNIYEPIAEVNDISGPERSRQVIDATSLDSEGGYREVITGFRDGGNVTLTMNFTSESFEKFDEDFNEDSPVSYRIELPDAAESMIDFDGLVTDTPLSIPTDDKVTVRITLKVSGPVVFTKKSD